MDGKLFLIPIITLLLNQFVKLAIEAAKGNFTWFKLFDYGGMPSSHSALVTSLTIVMGYYYGLSHPAFAISLIFSLIIIKDASGIRLKLGEQGKIINQLIKELPDKKEYKYPVMPERLGHTNLQVIVGIITSAIITSLLLFVW
jgi:acid phosphatase family membrane protein YuiD